jgi:hypothetical protein
MSRRERLLTIEDCAHRLCQPTSLIAHWIDTGLLVAVELEPGTIRILPRDLEAFVRAHPWLRDTIR